MQLTGFKWVWSKRAGPKKVRATRINIPTYAWVKITPKRQNEGNSQIIESRTMFLLRNICMINV